MTELEKLRKFKRENTSRRGKTLSELEEEIEDLIDMVSALEIENQKLENTHIDIKIENMNDEMKIEKLKENWDRITLSDIEAICPV